MLNQDLFSSKHVDSNALTKHELVIQQFNKLLEMSSKKEMKLTDFLDDFGSSLFNAVTAQNQPIYSGQQHELDESVMDSLSRKPFDAQKNVIRASAELLIRQKSPAVIINAEMGTGKTIMGIGLAAVLHANNYQRSLVLSPPHLVYKWRREILKTIPDAIVWILNGPDTLAKLLKIRNLNAKPTKPEFFILGRVRMRMGFYWKPSFIKRNIPKDDVRNILCCPSCGSPILDKEENALSEYALATERMFCKSLLGVKSKKSLLTHIPCGSPLWTMCRKRDGASETSYDRLMKAVTKLPTIGQKTANKLIDLYGETYISEILESNIQAFSNLLNEEGDFFFNERQAKKLDRALSKSEFSFGQGGYQPTEFIKRYLPKNYFGLMLVDEGHEYKSYGSAQGQAMGVLCRCVSKVCLLTGTLMGGYADDMFYLLWRIFPEMMMEDGFCYNKSNTLGSASMEFMRQHGVLKDITRSHAEYSEGSFVSSRGKKSTVSTSKAPGFSPLGIMRFVLPITVFLKLSDIGEGVLPPYHEYFREIEMEPGQKLVYEDMSCTLTNKLREALAKRDNTLTGVVMNALLAWPDCCFEPEVVYWKSKHEELFFADRVFDEDSLSPKEKDVLEVVQDGLLEGRKTLVFSVYSDTRDTTQRLKRIFLKHGIKAAVLTSRVKADEREDWLSDQIDSGVDVVICNPELVKTGLDMLEFPNIYFMNTGYNVYTIMQAARRSWRIGQKKDVRVYFSGYKASAQAACLELMGKKISVAQSTSGDMPDTGLDILNQAEDSIEVALAKQLIAKAA